MTLTLLLDLDDTLLINPLDQFIPAYLKSFAAFVADLVNPHLFTRQLLASTDKMISNNKINRSLQSTFSEDFYAPFQDVQDKLELRIDDFYQSQYPKLEQFTRPRPEALSLINFAINQGMTLVVATNPIFPLKAQLLRLEWANLSATNYPFSLVTGYESLHFAKPNPSYYAEILAQLTWPDQPACMIGDNYTDDILPANLLGISTFFINNPDRPAAPAVSGQSSGAFSQVENWINSPASKSKLCFSSKESILAGLQASPSALDSFLSGRQFPKNEVESGIQRILASLCDLEEQENLSRLSKLLDRMINIENKDEVVPDQLSIHATLQKFLQLRSLFISHFLGLSQKQITDNLVFFRKVISEDQIQLQNTSRMLHSV